MRVSPIVQNIQQSQLPNKNNNNKTWTQSEPVDGKVSFKGMRNALKYGSSYAVIGAIIGAIIMPASTLVLAILTGSAGFLGGLGKDDSDDSSANLSKS